MYKLHNKKLRRVQWMYYEGVKNSHWPDCAVSKYFLMVQNKKPASVGNRTQKVSVTAHHLYHRPKDDLPETHLLIYHLYDIT